MPQTYIISDHHFSHKNIIKFDNRPFDSVEKMNEYMTQRHNETVRPEDTVYFLGDFSFNRKLAAQQIKALNGRKILILGNHDDTRNKAFIEQFDEVHQYLKRKLFDQDVVMFHYPIAEWDKMHHGAIHFHGHVHGKDMHIGGRIFDVYASGNDLTPYNMEELVEKMLERDIRSHGG